MRIAGAVISVIAAIVQWTAIIERFSAAMWDWYKFWGYGGGGYITVGASTQLMFFLLSSIVAGMGLTLSWQTADDRLSRLSLKACRVAAIAVIAGMTLWAFILISPLVRFR